MTIQLGDFPVGVTIHIPFHTFDSDGASVTISNFAVGDILIYKDGGTTQRASTNGYTLLDTDGIDFDGITGVHGFSIDTSDDTDAGFYAAGHEYWVVVSSVTVDTQTVNFVAATFSLERAGGVLALLKSATYGLSAIESLVDDLESRLTAARAGYLDALNTGVPLADDAITSAKFDETTAYPLKADDSGSTYIARTGADSDTLETLSDQLDLIHTDVDAILADTGTDGVVVAAASKTGYKLASDGLDSISTTAPAGVASNFREMLIQTWRRFFKKATMDATEIKTYADNGTDVLTTQSVSDDGTTQTQGAAS